MHLVMTKHEPPDVRIEYKIELLGLAVSVADNPEEVPTTHRLHQNYPNPFNPATTINFDVALGGGEAVLQIFNLLGEEIRTLIRGTVQAGSHAAVWDGRDEAGQDVPSGIYLYQLRVGSFVASEKMLIIR
jgi:hypothetical protein